MENITIDNEQYEIKSIKQENPQMYGNNFDGYHMGGFFTTIITLKGVPKFNHTKIYSIKSDIELLDKKACFLSTNIISEKTKEFSVVLKDQIGLLRI